MSLFGSIAESGHFVIMKQLVRFCTICVTFLDGNKCVRCRSPYIEYTSENKISHNFVFNSVFDESSTQVWAIATDDA